jgi:hypothetical protein
MACVSGVWDREVGSAVSTKSGADAVMFSAKLARAIGGVDPINARASVPWQSFAKPNCTRALVGFSACPPPGRKELRWGHRRRAALDSPLPPRSAIKEDGDKSHLLHRVNSWCFGVESLARSPGKLPPSRAAVVDPPLHVNSSRR